MLRKKWKAIGAWGLSFGLLCSFTPFSSTAVKAEETVRSGSEAAEIAADILKPVIQTGDREIDMPDVQGGSVSFFADYEQVIGEDGTIYEPLEEKTVKGFYEVTAADGSVAKTEEFTVAVPGQYPAGTGENPKPQVIPALQEWHGQTGSFAASAAGRIVVGSEELTSVADIFARDFEDITGLEIPVIKGKEADLRIGDFYLSLTDGAGLGREGYLLDIGRAVIAEAEDAVGAYWATRSILQILKQNGGSIPKGLARDYPKYKVRGLNLDVARKPFTLDVLYDFAKNMSWYKLNSFQVHLSDNLIFMEDYASRDDAIQQAYAGFRLESEITNDSGKSATSEDLYYGKEEFRQFIKDSRVIGVDIVPELDFPAHALAFTRTFPEFMSDGYNTGQHSSATGQYRPLIDELDISNENAVKLVKDLWNEYLEGEDPVFDEKTTVHIGTDEFHGGGSQSNEYFRAFSNELITFLQEKGRTVRMWGSLTNKSGQTPVAAEGVQANIWSVDYGRPKQMYDLGYDLINTVDRWLYMVPNGTNGRGMYNDYLNVQGIYNSWKVNTMYEDTAYSYTVPAGDKQMLGACFAIWHDNIDTRASGISQYDSFLRFMDTAPVFSEKLWGDGSEDKSYADFAKAAAAASTAPNTVIGAKTDYASNTIADYTFENTIEQDESVNGYALQKAVNVKADAEGGDKTLKLSGGSSYVETPFNLLEPGAVLTMRVKMDEDAKGEQILCESKDKFGADGAYAIKASIKQTGNVGFSREGYDYSFDYRLPAGEWVELSFYSGENKAVSLHVKDADGETVYNNPKFYFKNHPDTEMSAARGSAHVNTLFIPFGRIGSDSDSFKGQIAHILLTGTKSAGKGAGAVLQDQMTVSACSEAQQSTDHTEGPAEYAVDGREDTYWHTNWASDVVVSDEEPHYFTVTLKEAKVISRLTYLPRQNSANGRILQYGIEVTKPDGTTVTAVEKENWANDSSQKTASFDPVEAKSVKLLIYGAQGDNVGVHATIAELNLYEPFSFGATELKEELDKYAQYQKSMYADAGWAAFEKALDVAWRILENKNSTEADCLYAYDSLRQKASGLVVLKDILTDSEGSQYRLAAAIKEAEEQTGNTADYTYESITAYNKALAAAQAVLVKSNPTAKELEEALLALWAAKPVTKLAAKREELVKAAADAGQKLTDTAGYTDASVDALRRALQTAQKVLADKNATLAELTGALDALKMNELIKDTKGGQITAPITDKVLKKGQKAVIGGMTYKATDAEKQEVTIIKGKNEKNVKIGATVVIGGVTCKITGIAANAFKNSKKVKTVVIGSNVVSIGKNAFTGCTAMTTVTIGKNAKTIYEKAFYNCKKLKKVVLQGDKAPSVKKNAFGKTAPKVTVQAKKMTQKERKALLNKLKKTGKISKKTVVK